MGRALIVSAGSTANEYLSQHLAALGYVRPSIVPSGAEARRRMSEGDFEIICVNAPLPDEFGHELCIDAMESTNAGVILLAKAAEAEQLEARMSEYGIIVLNKPFSNALFAQLIHMTAAGNRRLLRLRQENRRLQDKLAQLRLVCQAKCLMVERQHISEADAHRIIEKQAMDTRRPRGEIAQEIIDSLQED